MSSTEPTTSRENSPRRSAPEPDRMANQQSRRMSAARKRHLRAMKQIVKGSGDYCQALLSGIGWNPVESEVPIKVIGLTSCSAGAGVSMLSAQTAMTAAIKMDSKVLLIDANSLSPTVHQTFHTKIQPGFRNALHDAALAPSAIHATAHEQLFVMPFGDDSSAVPTCEMACSGLFKTMAADFQLVIIDLPAMTRSSTFLKWVEHLDAVLLVIPSGSETKAQSKWAAKTLQNHGAENLAVVLNRFRPDLIDRFTQSS